jgi:hypothetical protein
MAYDVRLGERISEGNESNACPTVHQYLRSGYFSDSPVTHHFLRLQLRIKDNKKG